MTESQRIAALKCIDNDISKKFASFRSIVSSLKTSKCRTLYSTSYEIEYSAAMQRWEMFWSTMSTLRHVIEQINLNVFEASYRELVLFIAINNFAFDVGFKLYSMKEDILRMVCENTFTHIEAGNGTGKSLCLPLLLLPLSYPSKVLHLVNHSIDAVYRCYYLNKYLTFNDKEIADSMTMNLNTGSSHAKITYMTYKCAFIYLSENPRLELFSHIIVDDADLTSDWAMSTIDVLKLLIKSRPEVKVIVTGKNLSSFTSDVSKLTVLSAVYPVQVHHTSNNLIDPLNYYRIVTTKIEKILQTTAVGNVVVYLPSRGDCFAISRIIKRNDSKVSVLKLHDFQVSSKIDFEFVTNQRYVILLCDNRGVCQVFPGVKYVIDLGLQEDIIHNKTIQRYVLNYALITKECACKRQNMLSLSPGGVCYRLYSNKIYHNMQQINNSENTESDVLALLLANLKNTIPMYSNVPSKKNKRILERLRLESIWFSNNKMTNMEFLPLLLVTDMYITSKIIQYLKKKYLLLCAVLYYCFINLPPMFSWGGSNVRSQQIALKFNSVLGDVFNSISIYLEWLSSRDKKKFFRQNNMDSSIMHYYDKVVTSCITFFKTLKIPIAYPSEMNNEDYLKEFKQLYLHENNQLIAVRIGTHLASYSILNNIICYVQPNSVYCYEKEGRLLPHMLMYHEGRYLMLHVTDVPKDFEAGSNYTGRLDISGLYTYKEIGPLGTLIMRDFCEKQLQEQQILLRNAVGDQQALIEIDTTRGIISLVYRYENVKQFHSFFDNFELLLFKLKSKFKKEFLKIPFVCPDGSKSNVIALFGPGCIMYDLVSPREYIDVKITNHYNQRYTLKDALPILESFGKILQWELANNNNTEILQITYITTEIAEKAYNEFISIALDATIEAVYFRRSLAQRESDGMIHSLKIHWQWMNHCDFATLTFSDDDSLKQAMLSLRGKLKLFKIEKPCKILVSKASSLRITEIPLGISEDDLILSLEYAGVKNVSYKLNFPLSRKDKNIQEAYYEASTALYNFVKSNTETDFELDFKMNPRSRKIFYANLLFKSEEDKLILESLFINGAFKLSDYPLFTSTSSIRLPRTKPYLDVVLRELETLRMQYQPLFVSIAIVTKGDQQHVIAAGEDVTIVRNAMETIKLLVEGELMSIDGEDKPLIDNPFGRKLLFNIGRQSRVFFNFGFDSAGLRIVGEKKDISAAREKIIRLLGNLKKDKVEEIDLSDSIYKRGVIKQIISEYGHNLERLECCGVNYINFDIQKKKIFIRGTKSAFLKVEKSIKTLSDQMIGTGYVPPGEACGVCFDDLKRNNVYRLYLCAHPFCKECLIETLNYHFKDRVVPIMCPSPGCEEPISFSDLEELAPDMKIESLTISACKAFVLRKGSSVLECPTINCPGVIKIHQNQNICFICGHTICIQCRAPSHRGVTCEMMKTLTNTDKELIDWIAKDPLKRKMCGNCKAPVEKTAGCNHMTCKQCEAHFCWTCLKVFPTGRQVYDHQPHCPRQTAA